MLHGLLIYYAIGTLVVFTRSHLLKNIFEKVDEEQDGEPIQVNIYHPLFKIAILIVAATMWPYGLYRIVYKILNK